VFRIALFETCDFVLVLLTTAWAFLVECSGIRWAWASVSELLGRKVGVKWWLMERRRWLKDRRGYELAERYVGV
jgi:hypothetical protein